MITELFKTSPQMKILLVGTHIDELSTTLNKFIKQHNGIMDICLFSNTQTDKIEYKTFYPKDHDSFCSSTSRDYEYIIVYDMLHMHNSPTKFIKNLYRALENSAEIIILQAHNLHEAKKTQDLLEYCEFRAANTIHQIYKNFDAVIAKKLHMWGNGL